MAARKTTKKKPPTEEPKLYSFKDHPEHEVQLGPWANRWIQIALRTEPQSDVDRKKCRTAMRGLYRAANLEPPKIGIFCASPIGGAIAATIAACVWWLREHPEKHAELFGRVVSEAEIMGAIAPTVMFAVRAAYGLPVKPLPPLDAATYAATYAATDAATYAATRAATDAATYAATRAATYAATDAATRAATDAATDAATRAATRAATDAATYAATDAATDAATRAATDAATYAATRAATDAATDAATRAATRAATDAATDAATYAATRAATDAATRAATRAATDAATDAATRAATDDLGPIVRFYIGTLPRWFQFCQGGNQWASWCSYLSFFREVAKLDLPVHEKWIHFENLSIYGGPRFVHEKFWIVSDFPTRIGRDDQNRPHSASGPSIAWSDGWSRYYWHGIEVPREWIESPKDIDPKTALTHPNAELRRCAAEIMGWDRVLRELGAKTVDADIDPEIGELVEATVEGNRERFLRVRCGTGRQFAIPVPPETATAIGAQAWIHDLPQVTIRGLEART